MTENKINKGAALFYILLFISIVCMYATGSLLLFIINSTLIIGVLYMCAAVS